ncbi:MAG: hypothetical protein WKG00_12205 [Polyangiaceae bacterium]
MPRCSFDGQSFLVVWAGADRTVGARVASDGTLLDAEPFAIGDPGTYWADVAFGGTDSLVLTQSDERIGLQRVASDGVCSVRRPRSPAMGPPTTRRGSLPTTRPRWPPGPR